MVTTAPVETVTTAPATVTTEKLSHSFHLGQIREVGPKCFLLKFNVLIPVFT